MAKGQQSGTSTVTQQLSTEQRDIMSSMLDTYRPTGTDGSKTWASRPDFNPSDPDTLQKGLDRVAPFSQDTADAFDQTRSRAFAHDAPMDAAYGATAASMAPTGQKMGLGQGWSTDASGNANFQSWNTDTARQYMSPYQDTVIGSGMQELARAESLKQNDVNDAAIKAGAFGGSRHGVQAAETTRGFADMGQKFLADTLDRGYQTALGQYNKNFDQGMSGLNYNKGIDDTNATRLQTGGAQLGSLAKVGSDLNAQSINALGNIGGQQQQQTQNVLDAAYNDQMQEFLFPAQLGQMISGFTAGPSTSTTNSAGGGSIWGSVLGAAGNAALPGIMSTIFSDERLKKDVKPQKGDDSLDTIREIAKGLKSYNYTEEGQSMGAPDGRHVSYMAQEREKVTGEPGPRHESGYMLQNSPSDIGHLMGAVSALADKVDKLTGKKGRKAA
jgi:hypothetical protein